MVGNITKEFKQKKQELWMRRSAFPEVLFWSGEPEALAAVPDLRNPPQHFSL